MSERDDEILDRLIDYLRRPVRVDPAFDARVMEVVGRAPPPRGRFAAAWRWMVTPRRVAISPLGGLALAAAAATMLLARPWERGPAPRGPGAVDFQFVTLAPHAAQVSLVGDFNDWDAARTPMRPARGGVWTAIVPLEPGRYRYAFLVNGADWIADPTAPPATDDEFGAPSSVVTVGGS